MHPQQDTWDAVGPTRWEKPQGVLKKKKRTKHPRGTFAVYVLAVGSVVIAVLTLLLISTERWHQQLFAGVGIKSIMVYVGLTHVTIEADYGSYLAESFTRPAQALGVHKANLAASPLANLFGSLHHTSLFKARDLICAYRDFSNALVDIGCHEWERIYWTSLLLLLGLGVSVLCNVTSAATLLVYWFRKPTKAMRVTALLLAAMQPVLMLTGLAIFGLFGGDLGRMLAPLKTAFPWLDLFSRTNSPSLGMSFFFSLILCALSAAHPMFFQCFVRKHAVERLQDDASRLQGDIDMQYAAETLQLVPEGSQQAPGLQGHAV